MIKHKELNNITTYSSIENEHENLNLKFGLSKKYFEKYEYKFKF
jgi:hypothetical protein